MEQSGGMLRILDMKYVAIVGQKYFQ